MDQVYILGQADPSGRRTCLYRYGNFCYSDKVAIEGADDFARLPSVLQKLQSIQGTLPYVCEYIDIPDDSKHRKNLTHLNKAIDFIYDEVCSSEEVLAAATAAEKWVDADSDTLYFEFETIGGFASGAGSDEADVIFAKTFRRDIMLTIIFFEGRYMVTLTEVKEEQALVDTLFPRIYGKARGLQIRAYDHDMFTKMSLWEASEPVPDPDDIAAEEARIREAAAAAVAAAEEAEKASDLSTGGYTQTYVVMKPKSLAEGSRRRRALFRFGNWCYGGEVELGADSLHLGDVPEVLPTLQRQQSKLAFLCEVTKVPASFEFSTILKEFQNTVAFLQSEIVASEDHLAKMAELGVTSWLDEDWGLSFFELKVVPTKALADVEVIACKTYMGTGIILHTVYFQGSLYAVLADAVTDQPLLDVAFPDVTARCRGLQIKSYSDKAALPDQCAPRRLSVWEGRRRGARGVGWGSGVCITEDEVASVKDAAKRKAELREEKIAEVEKRIEVEAKTAETSEEIDRVKATQDAVREARALAAKEAAEAEKDIRAAAELAAKASGKAESSAKAAAEKGGGGGGGKAADEEDGKKADGPKVKMIMGTTGFGARAPHHLPPMGGTGLARPGGLASMGPLPALGAAPWDKSGKPLGMGKVLGK